jgi:hypothetical protein
MPANAIANASNSIVLKALNTSDSQQFAKNILINPANRYIGFNTHLADINTNPNNIKHTDLAEYIGVSTMCHTFDGWNFFSRGIEALVNGDISSCIHFVYYAELRSIMGIMASEGIGIFEKKHVYYDKNDKAHTFNGPTHLIASELIKYWADSGKKKDTIFKTIQLNNFNLKDWITATGGSTTSAYSTSLVKEWFLNWSIDLRLKEDQLLRNENSYKPHFDINQVDITALLGKIIKIWESLEPAASNRFPDLDMHLSRIALEHLFVRTTGKPVTDKGFEPYITTTFNTIGEPVKQNLFDFILRKTSPDNHVVIQEANRDLHNNRINLIDPIPMICRALLLLRFSTGFANQTLNDSGVNLSNLKFWWEDIAYKIGAIDSTPTSIDSPDLYADIQEAIKGINASKDGISTIYETNLFCYPDLHNLKQFQRICFWGLGI